MRKTARENKVCGGFSSQSHRGGRDGDLFVRLGYRMHRGIRVMNLTANRDPFQLKLIDSCTRRKQMVRD